MPHIPSRDSYQDELNRLLVDIEEAKKELTGLEQQADEYHEEIKVLEEEREKLRKYEGLNIEEEVALKIQAAETEAEQIRLKAEEDARKSAEEIMDSMKSQGYLDGLEQGANEARQQIRDENQAGIESLTRLLEQLSGIREEFVTQNEGEIVELVLTIAEKVIGRQVKENPKTVVDMLREVMEQNRREEYIKIIVSKDLMPVEAKVSDQVKEILETLGQQVDIFVDPDGKPGSLLVESSGGFTDLSVDTQLKNIGDTLAQLRMEDEE